MCFMYFLLSLRSNTTLNWTDALLSSLFGNTHFWQEWIWEGSSRTFLFLSLKYVYTSVTNSDQSDAPWVRLLVHAHAYSLLHISQGLYLLQIQYLILNFTYLCDTKNVLFLFGLWLSFLIVCF